MHICQRNYAVGNEYDGQIGHRYFVGGRDRADTICDKILLAHLVEYDMVHHFAGVPGNRVSAVDVQDPEVGSAESRHAAPNP